MSPCRRVHVGLLRPEAQQTAASVQQKTEKKNTSCKRAPAAMRKDEAQTIFAGPKRSPVRERASMRRACGHQPTLGMAKNAPPEGFRVSKRVSWKMLCGFGMLFFWTSKAQDKSTFWSKFLDVSKK